MARKQQAIYDQMVANYVSEAAAEGITINTAEWSMYNLQRLIFWVVAGGMAIFEQVFDLFKTDVETVVAAASPQTGNWFQAQMLKFQYSLTDPQILEFDEETFAPQYPTVDTTLQIVKYCSVVPAAFGTSFIKVAKQSGGVPSALGVSELAAAQSYINLLSVPGITITATSNASDKIYIQATIYYNGLYASVISANVIAAIKAYLQIQSTDNPNGIPFNGFFTLSDLEVAIKSVAGVSDVVFANVRGRSNGTAFPGGTSLVISNTVVARNYSLSAGYCETETTVGNEITDTLTFIPV